MRKRTIALFSILFTVSFVCILVYRYFDSPRRALLADVDNANSTVVTWHVQEGGETITYAYRLDEESRNRFVRRLSADLAVDYLRDQATVTPMIGVYLTDSDQSFVAYYAIRCARGHGTSVSMKTLREIATNGAELTDDEKSNIFTVDLRSKWPHQFRFDYTLPVTQN